MQWVSDILGFPVKRMEVPRPHGRPYYSNSNLPIGVLHTTEGSNLSGAMSAFRSHFDPPHFLVGEGKIYQCRPLDARAAALAITAPHDPNKQAQIQIEMVGFSKTMLWSLPTGTQAPAVAVLAWCSLNLNIPLSIPYDWQDGMIGVPLPWAANNSRRKQAALGGWPSKTGWWMHAEVPWQGPNWHWDCGALKRSELLESARQLAAQHPLPH